MKHCPLFLGLWANWIGLGIHGMAWQLELSHLAHSGLHLCFLFLSFSSSFCFFSFSFSFFSSSSSFSGSGFIFLDDLHWAWGCSVRERRATSCAWCCIRCHSVMSYLGVLMDSAFGLWPFVPLWWTDLISAQTAIVFFFLSFFLSFFSLFRCLANFSAEATCLAVFLLVVPSPVD
ncbi:hypothetical protein V8C35DRAFT_287786 [Trichoderma chlorosporum]